MQKRCKIGFQSLMKYWGMFTTSITNVYKPDNYTETAFHCEITLKKEAVENWKLHLSFFRYLGATISTPCDTTKAAKWHGLKTNWRWFGSMMRGREIAATITGETLEGNVAKWCPHRGILLHLLCCFM